MIGPFSTLRLCIGLCLSFSALSSGAEARQGSSGPFDAGERWSYTAPVSQPWVPRSACLVGGDRWVFTALSGTNPGVALLASSELSGVPLWSDWSWSGVTGAIEVATDGSPEGLFALGGFPTASGRRYELRGYDALAAAGGAGFAPAWTNDLGLQARVFFEPVSSQQVVVVSELPGSAVVDVRWLDRATGLELSHVAFGATGLRDITVDAVGTTVAILTSTGAYAVSQAGVTQTWTTNTTQQALELDVAGERLALADLGRVRLFENFLGASASFVPTVELFGVGSDIPLRMDWSDDGQRLAVGWWSPLTTDVRCAVYDTLGAELFSFSQSVSGVQNYPATVALDATGERLALGTWGDSGGASELWLFDVNTGNALLDVDLGGSVDDLALAPDGTRVVVAQRLQHANQFGSRGSVRMFGTGERDLILRTGARLGANLVARYLQPTDDPGLFLMGLEASTPFVLGGGGLLFVDPTRALIWSPGSRVGSRELEFSLQVPLATSILGQPWVLQAATFTPQGLELAETVLRPRAL